MSSWGRAVRFGVLAWLIPFIVAFLVFPFRESARPLFESVMAVTVTATVVLFGIVYLRRAGGMQLREGLGLGLLWLGISILIDAPLMLLGGPMKMSLADYMADIGLTYAIMPIVTAGLALASSAGTGKDIS